MNPYMVMWPVRCCNSNSKQGFIFTPKEITRCEAFCTDCKTIETELIAVWRTLPDGRLEGFPIYRLKELKPPTFEQLIELTNRRLNTPQRVQDRASRPVALLSTYFGDLT